MEICQYCGKPKTTSHSKYFYMCEDCGKLYKRYTDLRCVVKNASIKQANKADKKLIDIVDIYKERAAQGLKVPPSVQEYTAAAHTKRMLGLCEWCGRTNVTQHSRHVGMCEECGKDYDALMRARSTISKLVGKYRENAAKGYRVPIVMRDYGIGGK